MAKKFSFQSKNVHFDDFSDNDSTEELRKKINVQDEKAGEGIESKNEETKEDDINQDLVNAVFRAQEQARQRK